MSSFFHINNLKILYIYRIQMAYQRRDLPNRTWKFPEERQSDYKGTITFRPVRYTPPEVQGSAISSLFRRESGNGALAQFVENGASAVTEAAVAGFQEGRSGSSGGVTSRDVFAAEGPEATLDITPTDNETITTPAVTTVNRGQGVILYLPAAIRVNDAVAYDAFDLGSIGAIGLGGMQAGQGATTALARGVGQATGSLIGLLEGNVNDQRGARLASARLAELGGATTRGVIRAGLATTANPNSINLFKSVNLREFQFDFKLIANSAREADAIENIVKFFRLTMYPDTINFDPNGLDIPLGYEFPDKFEITMRYNDEPVGVRILHSVLRNVSTSYNPSSMSWHKDGKPSEVDISLTFGEERALNRNDIFEGY
jgi:hypothetical protein